MTPTVAVAGEVLTDLVPDGPDGRYRAVPGGSPGNVAVGLARLGVPTRMLARLSDDVLGRRLRAHLAGNGVDLGHTIAAAEPSSLAVVALRADGAADYDFRIDGAADWAWTDDELSTALDGVAALHLGSLAVLRPPGDAALRRLADRARGTVTVSVDPNVRPALLGRDDARDVLLELLAIADVVKASAEDAAWLEPGRTPAEAVQDWLAAGPALVVVTRGAEGALAVGAQCGLVERPGRRVDVVDTVGAGDSFTSALLAGLARRDLLDADRRAALGGLSAAEVGALLDEAIAASALTCTRSGADPPYAEELARSVVTRLQHG